MILLRLAGEKRFLEEISPKTTEHLFHNVKYLIKTFFEKRSNSKIVNGNANGGKGFRLKK